MAVNQNLIDQAEAAYHSLVTGQSVAKFRDQNGEEVTYFRANKAELAQYILELKGARPLGPMRPWF